MTFTDYKTRRLKHVKQTAIQRLITCLMVVVSALTSISKADTIVIGTYLRFEDPLAVASEAVLKEAYQRINVPVKFKDLPVARAMSMMLAGTIDGNIFRIKALEDAHPELIRVKPAINSVVVKAYSKNPTIKVRSWHDLKDYRVAYMRGVILIENNLPAGIKTYPTNTDREAIRITSTKAADIMLFAEAINIPPDPYATQHYLGRIETILAEAPLYHYLIAKHSDTAAKLSTTLKKMAKEGEIQQIQLKALKGMKKPR